jgi:hypothetical protein
MTRRPIYDPLGVLERHGSPVVALGATDITNALRGGSVHQALSSRGDVHLTLDVTALPPDPVDYLAPLSYQSSGTGVRAEFIGHVANAHPQEGRIELEAHGASLLTEQRPGLFVAFGVAHNELVYTMARSAGMSDEEVVIGRLDELEPEVFEVMTPMHGVVVDAPRHVAAVTILPADHVTDRLVGLGFADHADELHADAFALSLHTAALAYGAEQAGLRDIDTALDLLATRLQHALAVLPDGTPQRFDRAQRLARPRRGDVVAVRGLTTGRRWLRAASPESLGLRATLDVNDPLLHIDARTLSATHRLALAACRRASTERDPLARVQALWEAIECLAAGVKVPHRWAKSDLKAIKCQLPDELPPELRRRVETAIDDLNQSPLMARFRELIERDGLPISEAEIKLLAAIRRIRNDAVHGRPATPPPPADLDHATAIVARLVVEHLIRRPAIAPRGRET